MRLHVPQARGRQRRLIGLSSVALAVIPSVIWTTSFGYADGTSSGVDVTATKTASRQFVDAQGNATTVDSRNIAVTVSQTTSLQDQQVIHVSWSGAHPTGGVVPDPVNWPDNGGQGAQPWLQEYPFILMECRGTDSTSVPAAQQVSPQTCWTQYRPERNTTQITPENTDYPAWRLDADAPASERVAQADVPAGTPASCILPVQHWLPFVAADGTSYPTPSQPGQDCGAQAPEGSVTEGTPPLPSNTVYASTNAQGNGSSDFEVRSAAENASLGCSSTVACSLVMIPIEGVSCDAQDLGQDPTGAAQGVNALSECESTGNFAPGSRAAGQSVQVGGAPAVEGFYWWSASNWKNRISIPLSLLPANNVCDLNSNGQSTTAVYGSEILGGATLSWAPKFCTDSSLFDFKHVHDGEPTALNLLEENTTFDPSAGVVAAFTSDPPEDPFNGPTALAPVAVSGFGIAYEIDDSRGVQYRSLKLTPRLLAKMLTESYPALASVQKGDPGLAHNPIDMTADPEFQALNPGIPVSTTTDVGAAVLQSISANSDVMSALTGYINADPEARAWLNGLPDPWGMVVNPNYKGISLPVNSWPLLDTWEDPARLAQPATSNGVPNPEACYSESPAPILNLIAQPTINLANIALAVHQNWPLASYQCGAISTSDGVNFTPDHYTRTTVENTGSRFIIGVVSLADAARLGLPLASLQTQVQPTAAAKFTDARGRAFVTPTTDSLRAAAQYFTPDATTSTWPRPYTAWHAQPGAVGAYPGTMIVYGAFPTQGLDSTTAGNLAKLLQYAATTGQQAGTDLGELPAGYLPMTSANGVGGLASYTLLAANDVQAQNGLVPALVPVSAPGPTTKASAKASASPKKSSTTTTTAAAVNKTTPVSGGGAAVAAPAATTAAPSSTAAASHTVAAPPAVIPEKQAAEVAKTKGVSSVLAGWLLPVLFLAGLAGVGFTAWSSYRPGPKGAGK